MESSRYNSDEKESPGKEDQEGQVVSEEEVVQVASMADIGTPQVQVTVDDIVGTLSEINLTPLDDEPPDDMLLTPRDSTADLSPVAQESGFTRRLQTVADTVRPKPSVSVSNDEPPRDEASAEATGAHRDHTNDYEENTL